MLPLHRAETSVFNYDEIPAGYYFQAMIAGRAPQRFWHREKFREVAARLPVGARVLDFGCGPGSFLHVLGEERTDLEAVGVDIASRQIRFAEENVAHGKSRLSFVRLEPDLQHLPFPDASFDAFTCIEVIEHLHPFVAQNLLREAGRLLKPGGKLVLTTPNYRSLWPLIEACLERLGPVKYHEQHISKFTPNAFVKFLEAAGFEVRDLRSIFLFAPFFATLSVPLAERFFLLEKAWNHLGGSLLVAEARKVPWANR